VKSLAIMTLILLPALAWGQRDERNWKFENRETIHRSFDVSSAANAKKLLVDNSESKDGKFVYRSSNRMTAGRTGKGGPELSFDTFNGSIRLHSKAL
jgi:hypothetical protein